MPILDQEVLGSSSSIVADRHVVADNPQRSGSPCIARRRSVATSGFVIWCGRCRNRQPAASCQPTRRFRHGVCTARRTASIHGSSPEYPDLCGRSDTGRSHRDQRHMDCDRLLWTLGNAVKAGQGVRCRPTACGRSSRRFLAQPEQWLDPRFQQSVCSTADGVCAWQHASSLCAA